MSPANALVASSAELSNLGITLIDLAPADGIAPYLIFSGNPINSGTAAVAIVQNYTGGVGGNNVPTYSGQLLASVSATGQIAEGSASAVISFTGQTFYLEGTTVVGSMAVQGSTPGNFAAAPGSGARTEYSADAWSNQLSLLQFVLSANTSMSISAAASVLGSSNVPGGFESFSVRAELVISSPFAASTDSIAFSNSSLQGPIGTVSVNRQLIVTLENSSSAELFGSAFIGVSASGQSYVPISSPVPESSTAAMMLIGLIPLWFYGRRNSYRRSSQT